MKIKKKFEQVMKKEKALTLQDLAEKFQVSTDYILGLIDSDSAYYLEEDVVVLSGLGLDKCIICTEPMDEWDSLSVEIPAEMMRGYRLKKHLKMGIRGHRKCYSTIDVFFRYKSGLRCIHCWYFDRPQQFPNGQVEEVCRRLHFRNIGDSGFVAFKPICNYFKPSYELTKLENANESDTWKKIEPILKERTLRGYKILMAILEKVFLLERQD